MAFLTHNQLRLRHLQWQQSAQIGLWHNALTPVQGTLADRLDIMQPGVLVALPALLAPSQDNLRLVQLSDLHFYHRTDPAYYHTVAQVVHAATPQLIVLTGDCIHNRTDGLAGLATFLAALPTQAQKVAILGNHDYMDTQRSALVQGVLREAGFTVLVNDILPLPQYGLVIVGVDDYRKGRPDWVGLRAKIAPWLADVSLQWLWLAHNPQTISPWRHHPDLPTDIMLCGHTHGGHVYIPALEVIYQQVLHMRYRYGRYPFTRPRGQTQAYVTSGLGGAAFYWDAGPYSGDFPRFRWNTWPEVVVIDRV